MQVLEYDAKSRSNEKPGIVEILLSGSLNNMGNIYMLSPEGIFTYVSQCWAELLGYDQRDLVGQSYENIFAIESISQFQNLFVQLLEGQPRAIECQIKHRDGTWRWYASRINLIEDKAANQKQYIAFTTDITEQKRAETALLISEERFSKAFRCNPDPISISTLNDGCFVEVNDAWIETTGYQRHEAIGRTVSEINIWNDSNDRKMVVEQLPRPGGVRGMEVNLRCKAGEVLACLFSAEIIEMDNEPHLLAVVKDISQWKKAKEKIKYLSRHDKLTGLYSRDYIEEEFSRINNDLQVPISLIMGDVNGLKLVNDALGHQAGDRLLVTVAEILKNSCYPENIIARWGGDEFIILLTNCDSHTAARVCKQIKQASLQASDLMIKASIALGMATKETMVQDINELIREAEDKMYRNKLMESRSARSVFLTSLEKTLWTRSYETEEHCQRVQKTALKIGQSINLPESEIDNLKLLASLHDIGKIAIPNSILDKPGRLTAEEWELIKKHPETGYHIALSSPELAPLAEAILHHHEHWNGGGYPLRLQGEDIPILARIIAIADAYDVMIKGRSYQPAVSSQTVWEELKRCAGTQFDPQLVNIAIEVLAQREVVQV